jgi:hypothetical protein
MNLVEDSFVLPRVLLSPLDSLSAQRFSPEKKSSLRRQVHYCSQTHGTCLMRGLGEEADTVLPGSQVSDKKDPGVLWGLSSCNCWTFTKEKTTKNNCRDAAPVDHCVRKWEERHFKSVGFGSQLCLLWGLQC